MKKTIISSIVLVVVIIAGYVIYRAGSLPGNKYGKDTASYRSDSLGVMFSYPNEYVIEEKITNGTSDQLATITVWDRKDADALANGDVPMESPAHFSVSVFKNSKKQFASTWADSNPQVSNSNLKTGSVAERVVGGANAISYMTNGLYPTEVVIVAHGQNVYVISGQFMDPNDEEKRKAFQSIVDSVTFIPTPEQADQVAGKIDINAVCEGALAYTTFPDAVAAEKFVEDCKAGKHPEIIEQFKASLNLGADVAL